MTGGSRLADHARKAAAKGGELARLRQDRAAVAADLAAAQAESAVQADARDALNAVLAASATAVPALPGKPYVEPEKPAKVKKEKAAPAPEPEPEPTVEQLVDRRDHAETALVEAIARDEWIKKIKAHVRDRYNASGDKLMSKKEEYKAMLKEYDVTVCTDLKDDQFAPCWETIQAL